MAARLIDIGLGGIAGNALDFLPERLFRKKGYIKVTGAKNLCYLCMSSPTLVGTACQTGNVIHCTYSRTFPLDKAGSVVLK